MYSKHKEETERKVTIHVLYLQNKRHLFHTDRVELDGNIVKNVKFTGGCQGNLQAIPRLVEGMTVEEVERRISGIHCGMKNTSCGDQLAKALREAYDAQKNA